MTRRRQEIVGAVAAVVVFALGFGVASVFHGPDGTRAALLASSSTCIPGTGQHCQAQSTSTSTTTPTTTAATTTAPTTTAAQPVDVLGNWKCLGPVSIDWLRVTVTPTSPGSDDGVNIGSGCTGRIGRLDIIQNTNGDGMKIGEGSHDVVIASGTFTFNNCHDGSAAHQDAVQAMGGQRVTLTYNVVLNPPAGCQKGPINDSAFFMNQGTNSTEPPTDIVCDTCTLRSSNLTNTAFVNNSVRSGLRNSLICGNYRKGAADAIDENNTVGANSLGC